MGVKKQIKQLGIQCLNERKVIAVTKSGVCLQNAADEMETLQADTVVLAIGSRSRTELSKALEGLSAEISSIGDAVSPGKISSCISDAVELATRI